MKKLKLDLDQIQVTSYSPQPTHGGSRGTVEGLEEPTHIDQTCIGCFYTAPDCTEYLSCVEYTCPATVAPTH
jgi:hypothetical protein